ncbi:MAG: CHAT domain-containing protein [Chlorobi bacterium]|nr:CHAT domain-containing protein [Chlorobiota bacterium]
MQIFFTAVLLPAILFSAGGDGALKKIQKEIERNGFNLQRLETYDFILRNYAVNQTNENKFLEKLKPSFGRDFLAAEVKFKGGEFKNAFNLLLPHLTDEPEFLRYYHLLAKTAQIIRTDTLLLKNASKTGGNFRELFLLGLLHYNRSDFDSAKRYFSEASKLKPDNFEIKYMLGYTARNLGNYEAAIRILDEAETLLKSGSPEIAKLFVAKGSLYYLSGDYGAAKEYYEKGKTEAEKYGYNIEKIKALLNIAMIKDEEGKLNEARKDFIRALKLAEKIQDKELAAICNSELAVSYTYTNELVQAKKLYKQSYALFKKLHNNKRIALAANNIGSINLSVANYIEALQYYQLGLLYAGDNPRTRMLLLRGVGNVYMNLSNYSEAVEYFNKAKKIASKIKDITGEAETDISFGVLFYNLDQSEKALKYLKDGLSKIKEDENPYLVSDFYQKIGIVENALSMNEQAEKDLRRSEEISGKFGFIYNELLGKTWLAYILLENAKPYEALAKINEVKEQTKPYELYQLLGVQTLFAALAYDELGDKKNKLDNLLQTVKYSRQANDYNNLIEANYRLGKYFLADGKTGEAEKYFERAINLIEDLSGNLLSHSEIQIAYFSKQIDVYNGLIDIYLSESEYEKALELIDRSRSRNTLANLLSLKLQSLNDNNELIQTFYDLSWKIQNSEISGKEMDSLKNEYSAIKERLKNEAPEISKYLSNSRKSFSLEAAQKELNKNQYLISFYVNDSSTYYFKIGKYDFESGRIDDGRKKLLAMISAISPYYNSKFKDKNVYFNKDLFAFNSYASNRLYLKIIRPVLKDLPENAELVFSLPTEMLNLPLEFLVTQYPKDSSPFKYDDKRFLVNDFAVSYSPSIAIWNELKERPEVLTDKILLIGDPSFINSNENLYAAQRGATEDLALTTRNIVLAPLRYSRSEIESIDNLLSGNVFLGKSATETSFKKNCENTKLIHISSHSLLYKNNPLIIFSNSDNENDGYLETGEILQLKLNSDLVVLSSCKSGLGEIDRAEGILGMEKAFFEAGAKSIIISDWDVDDKYTSNLMEYFYSFLSEGFSKSEALKKAKLKFIKEVSGNPYYWAAFRLSGNDAPLEIKANLGSNNSTYIVLLLLLIIIPFFTRRYFKNKI